MNSPRIDPLHLSPRGRRRKGISYQRNPIVKQFTQLNAAWLARCLHAGREGREPLKKVACGKIKNPDRAGIFCPTLQSHEASIGRGSDATVIATLPNPPAEVADAHSRKLSSESIRTAQAPDSPLVFVCVPTARRHTCKTLKGSLSFGEMRNVRAVNC